MKDSSLFTILVFLVAGFWGTARAQTHNTMDEVPIESCDRLPVIAIKVAGENRRFLLDTAATTILNLTSFTSGDSKQIHIYSWTGSTTTSAREILLPLVEVGTHTLRDLKLPAVDLGPIGKSCGGQIDGILGVDLLDSMGMTIDLKRRIAFPALIDKPEDPAGALAAAEGDMGACDIAFNHGDVKAMTECFDPEIVFYTQQGEYMGREEVMRYLRQRYFKFAPKLRYDMSPHDARIFGDVLWYSYNFWIDTPEEHRTGHGMTMCRKDAGGRWRILAIHNSVNDATSTRYARLPRD